jgi:CBS domain-containing protein
MKQFPVRNMMKSPVHSIDADEVMSEAAETLKDLNIGALMVTDGDEFVGIVSERDFVYNVAAEGRNPAETRVRDVMTSDVTYGHVDDSIHDCYELMGEHGFRHLPLKDDDGKVAGLVSIRSIFGVRDDTHQFLIDQLKKYIKGER